MLESGIQKQLVADPAVQGIIGSRCYAVVWPSDAPDFPLCTYQLISTVTSSTFAGTLSLTTCRMQVDCWAKDYATIKSLASAVTNCLQDFQSTLPDGTQVVNITLDSSSDLYDSPSSTFRVQTDFLIQFYR